jgi:hypothetical protein
MLGAQLSSRVSSHGPFRYYISQLSLYLAATH